MAAQAHQGLSRRDLALPSLRTALAVLGAGALAGVLLGGAIHAVGPAGALAPVLAVGCLILLRFPGLTTALLLVGVVLIEPEDPGLLPTFNSFYNVIRVSLTPVDILFFLALAGLLMRFARDGIRPDLPTPLTGALALLGLATVAGIITGVAANASVSAGDLYHRAMNDAYVILVPLLVVNVVRDSRALRIFAAIVAILAAVKGLSGTYSALAGIGSQLTEETISYLEPVPNLIMLTLLLGTLAALVRRVRLPVWVLAGAPLSLLALVLSYRRSFWIAAAFTLIVVLVLASRRRGRAVLLLTGVVGALAFGAVATVGTTGPTAKPLVKRAQTLSPAGIETDRGDRYRTDERHNVIANIEEHPLTGIGLGVPWKIHQPLAETHDRTYAHVAILWFWLAYGPLGAIAYLLVIGAGLWAASRIWSGHPDPLVQVGAFACFGALLAIVVVELTATFTGIEPRFSLVLGGLLGWLAAAWRDLPRREPSQGLA